MLIIYHIVFLHTDHTDCAIAKFKDKDEKYPRKDFCQGEQDKTKRDDCAKVTFENGTHLIDMQEKYHFWCHKYFLRYSQVSIKQAAGLTT